MTLTKVIYSFYMWFVNVIAFSKGILIAFLFSWDLVLIYFQVKRYIGT